MKKISIFSVFLVILLVAYAFYVIFLSPKIENYSDIIVAVTFFFTLFSGFFITRQNDRYTAIADEISNTDGLFSLLYRLSGVVPRVQAKVREALRDHYQKILGSNNWAYHILNPSTTITKIFKAYSEIDDKEREKLGQFSDGFGGAFADVQVSRKKMIMLYDEKLLPLQWTLVYILAVIMIISFNFIPVQSLFVDILKIFFGACVLLVIFLLKQLDNLTIFGKDFNEKTAGDILRIIDEKDIKEIEARSQ